MPPWVRKSVAFVLVEKGGTWRPNGTAFLVCANDRSGEKQVIYLVTARHVLQGEKEVWYKTAKIRFTQKTGGLHEFSFPLVSGDGSPTFWEHEDETVDLAVAPIRLPINELDVQCVFSHRIATRKKFKDQGVSEGTNVFFAGLFVGFQGSQKNQPIVRFGRVSLIPTERIPWGSKRVPTALHVVETTSYGGNSGSPVFYEFGRVRARGNAMVFGGTDILLSGVMKGRFNEYEETKELQLNTDEPNKDSITVTLANSGLAAVVPSHFLIDILESEQATKQRGYPLLVDPPESTRNGEETE